MIRLEVAYVLLSAAEKTNSRSMTHSLEMARQFVAFCEAMYGSGGSGGTHGCMVCLGASGTWSDSTNVSERRRKRSMKLDIVDNPALR